MVTAANNRIAPAPPRRRRLLFGGSALCSAGVLWAAGVQAQTLPAIPDASSITVTSGGAQPMITLPDANTLDVNLLATRTVINWASFHVSGADSVTFHFGQASDIVLNKSPTAVQIDAGGQVKGLVGASPGGNIWFYSPNGVVISPGAVMTAGNFVFARGTSLVDLDFVGDANPLTFLRAASDALIQIDAVTTATMASISPTGDLVLSASTGDVTATTALAAGSATITATAGSVTLGEVTATNGAATVTASGGSANVGILNGFSGASATGSTAVSVTSATSGAATGDIVLTAGTVASLGSGTGSRDIKVLGPAASLGSGTAARDVFVTATTGGATVTGVVSAGDDIEVTATTGSVSAGSASLTSTGVGATDDAHVLVRSDSAAVSVGAASTQGVGAALADVTIQAATTASLGSGGSTRDIKVLGPAASLGSGTAARDVFVTATTGGATVTGVVSAGDDIEVTATTGSVSAGGASLTSTGVGATDDAHVLVRSDSAAVSVGSASTQGVGAALADVTIQAATTVTLNTAASASRDLLLLAGDSVLAGSSVASAGRDLVAQASTGNVTLGVARADDDIAVRALAGSVTATGDLQSGRTQALGDPDPTGAADALLGVTMVGHDLDIKAQTIAVAGNVSAGRTPGNAETLGAAQLASDVTVLATGGDPSSSVAALRLATGVGKRATAHQDIHVYTESLTGASILTGGLSAGRDIAVYSPARNIQLGSALAGDDIVVRAPNGMIEVTGDLKAGRDAAGMTATDAVGAADDLNTALPFLDFDGNPATIFSVVGFDVNLSAQSIMVGGSTVAGREPSTDSPDTAGPVDATTSDVRIQTRLTMTPVLNLAPNIVLGSVTATRDLQIDSAKAVTTGDLIAGRDIAVLGRGGVTPGAAAGDHSGSGVTLGSARAGDDMLAFSIYGRTSIMGGATSGQLLQRLVPTNNRLIDGATEAADQLAIYLRYFDLDDASAPYVLKGGVIHIVGQGVDVGGNLSAQGVDSDVRLRSSLDIVVTGDTSAAGFAVFQTDAAGGGSVTTGAVTAGREVLLDGVGVVATGTLTAHGGDVAVRSRSAGAISLAGISASDDVVVRGAGQVTIGGPVSSGGGADSAGFGDVIRTSEGSVMLEGQSFDLTGGDIDILAGSVTTTGALAAAGAGSDVRVQSAGVISLGAASAGRDVLVDGGAAVTTGVLAAGRDVGVRSLGVGSAVTVGGATAGDDVVIRSKAGITITGVLSAGGGTDSNAADQAGDLMFGAAKSALAGDLDLVGRTVDVRSSAGSIQVAGAVNAATDARFQTAATNGGSVKVGTVTAGRSILLDGGTGVGVNGVEATGTLTATDGDVAVRARNGTAIRLLGVSAGDDVALRTTGSITGLGTIATTGRASTLGLADRLTDPTEGGVLSFGGLTFDLNSSDIDVLGDAVSIQSLSAMGSARIKAGNASVNGGGSVGVDILVDSNTSLTVGDLTALGDIALRSRTGSLSVGRLVAGDDLVLRAATGVSAISLKANGVDRFGVGDQMFASDPTLLGEGLSLQGNTIDIRATGGPIAIGDAEAAGDIRLQAMAGDVSASGNLVAGRDILADGASVLMSGSLTAAGDVALYARSGRITLNAVTAGDDIVARASGDVMASGLLKSGQGAESLGLGDRLFALEGTTRPFGGPFDLVGGILHIQGDTIALQGRLVADGAGGGVRLQSIGRTTIADAEAIGDLLIDAGGDISTGALGAGGDIALRSTGGSVAISSATAGDDVVVRAAGPLTVSGQIRALGGLEVDGAGDRLFALDRFVLGGDFDLVGQNIDLKSRAGPISAMDALSANGDVRLQTSGGSISTRGLTAGRDVVLDGASVVGGNLRAGRDIAIRAGSGAITLTSATAGDDLVLRASGDITLAGAATASGGVDATGAADRLFATDRSALGGDFDLIGLNIDLKSTSGRITTNGPLVSATDIRLLAANGAMRTGDLNAGRDVLLDASQVASGAVQAGRDIAIRSRIGSIALVSATAGDDLVLRAAGDVNVTGVAMAQGGADGDGAGDRLFATDRTALNGALSLLGANLDVKGLGAIAMAGAVVAGQDARFQTVGAGSVNLAAVSAGGDILADGRSVRVSGRLASVRDVAVRARAGSVDVTSITAGDDIAIRASGGVKATGSFSSGSGATAIGLADRLVSTAESGMISRLVSPTAATASIEGFTLGAGDIDIRSGEAISIEGALTATGTSSIRLQAGTRLSLAAATAGDTIFVRSRDLALGGAWRATTARIEVTAAGGLALGDGVTAPSDGLALSNAQIGMIDAPTLQIFAGDSSGALRGASMAIGKFDIDTAKIRTALELYAGSMSEVRITGAFAPLASAANTTTLRIGAPDSAIGGWTPQSIKVIADNGGSIGVATTTGGRTFTDVRGFGAVELNARGDILMGYQDFIDKLAATPAASVSKAVRTIIAPQSATGSRILITAGSLALRADGKVAQQDTSGLLGSTPTGLYLFGGAPGRPHLLLGRTSIPAAGVSGLPEYIELNGALLSGTTVMTGQSVSLSNLIAFDKGVSPNQYYRLNTCEILQQGNCTPASGSSTINIAPDQLTGLTIEDRTAAAGTADPTVASATNEEVWKDPD